MILTPNILARIAALILAVVLIQVSFLSGIALFGGGPDLALLVVIVLGLLGGVTVGAVAGFSVGLLIDCLIAAPLGSTALALILAGYLAGLYRERATRGGGRLATPLICLLLTLVAELALFAVHLMLGQSGPMSWLIAREALLLAVYAFVLAIPVYAGIRRLLRPALVEDEQIRPDPGTSVLGI